MRIAVALLLVSGSAFADVSAGASVGAGAQGAGLYSALELRLDAAWPDVRVGLGVRGVWDDGVFRRREWASAADAVAIIRDVSARYFVGDVELGAAAGALAPAQVGHVVDGYRVALDDRWRTGVRVAARSEALEAGAELDDVLDPALVAAGARWQMAPPWGIHAAFAIDPTAPRANALEVGIDRRFEAELAQFDVGVAVVGELTLGASAVAFANAAIDRVGVRWTARADVRAGTGSAGALFGPLYRIERLAHAGHAGLVDRARAGELEGLGAGIALGAAAPLGWVELGARDRPGLGALVTASAGAPMNRWLQAAAWAAIGTSDAAGASELRVAWARSLFSALQLARVYRFDAMEPVAVWSLTAWFGATTP